MNAEQLQQQSREILQESRFQEPRTPSPFSGVLRRLGEWLEPVLGPIGRFLERVFERFGDWWAEPVVRFVLLAGVVALVVALSTIVIRRRSAVAVQGGRDAGGSATADPDVLDRAAQGAEEEGDFAEAVRLRFQAGVLRLQRDGVVRRARSTPTRAIGRQVRVEAFDRLGRTFDAVTYGHREASADDAAEARREWPRVLAVAGKNK